MLAAELASLELRSFTPQPAPLRVVKRSTRRILPGDEQPGSRVSSGESTSIDERIESATDALRPYQALSVRKRGQEDLTFKATRAAPAFRRLLRPERSYVKLPAAPARHEPRVQSNGESPTFTVGPPSSTTHTYPQTSWFGVPGQGMSSPLSVAYDDNGAIQSTRFPPPGAPGYEQPSRPPEPKVLVPQITITPETSALEEGNDLLWVAIEISGRIVSSNVDGEALSVSEDTDVDHQRKLDTDLLKFGCLMDLRVEILPLRDVFVTKILQEEPAPTSLDASSTILILVQVQFRPSWGEDQRRSSLSTISDSLIEDLEQQLGSSHADYLQVRVTYSHPAFPSTKPGYLSTPRVSRPRDGISSLHTSLETNATAALERRDLTSPWSPRPKTRTPNPLFRIVAAHWGPQRTANAIHEILDRGDTLNGGLDLAPQSSTQSSRRVSASTSYSSGNESTGTAWRTVVNSEGADGLSNSGSSRLSGCAATTPVVPQRRTSLQKNNTVRQPQPTRQPDRVFKKPRMSLEYFRNMPFTEIGPNARPRMTFAPRIADTSRPRVFGSANSPGCNVQNIAEDASKMKENRTPNSHGGSSAKNSPYSESLPEFGLRAKMRKGSSTRKSSAASRTTGRWGWGGWW